MYGVKTNVWMGQKQTLKLIGTQNDFCSVKVRCFAKYSQKWNFCHPITGQSCNHI